MSSRHSAVALGLLVALGLSGCGSQDSPGSKQAAASPADAGPSERATSGQQPRRVMAGYPLERTLSALVGDWSNVDTVVVVTPTQSLKPVVVRGSAAKGEKPLEAQVTPMRADVVAVLKGKSQADVLFPVLTDPALAEIPRELSPGMARVKASDFLLIAGVDRVDGQLGSYLDPHYIYRVTEGREVVSLLESAGDEPYPRFSLDQLTEALKISAVRLPSTAS